MTSNLKESCLTNGLKRCGIHICVLGCIGAGKTTLCHAIQEHFHETGRPCAGFYEPVDDNPVLPLYYQDPERYAFAMQIYMFNRRLRQQRDIQDDCRNGMNCVQDSSVFGDTCFVDMLCKDGIMSQVESDIYSDLFVNVGDRCMYPTLVVFLNCTPEVAMERIKKRNRGCESGISFEYLANLNYELKDLMESLKRFTHVKEIDYNQELNDSEIADVAKDVLASAYEARNNPIISRMGL